MDTRAPEATAEALEVERPVPQHPPSEPAPAEPDELEGPILGRDAILGADDLVTRRVAVPEWGGVVIVRALTAAERDHYEAGFLDESAYEVDLEDKPRKGPRKRRSAKLRMADVRARLAALTVVDAQGRRLFGDEDVKELGRKSAAALDRVVTAARELSGMTEADLEDLAEGFDSDPSEGDDTA